MRKHFCLDEQVVQLNSGSYGSIPLQVLEERFDLLRRVEKNVDLWMRNERKQALDVSRSVLASLLNVVDEKSLTFVENTTAAFNGIIRSMVSSPNDVVVYYSTIYDACRFVIDRVAAETKAKTVCILIDPRDCSDERYLELTSKAIDEKIDVASNGGRVIFVVDAITSLTGAVVPYQPLCALVKATLQEKSIVCVDGAHAVGQTVVDLSTLKADFFIASLHKWLFCPRGSGMLFAQPHQHHVRPAITSYGDAAFETRFLFRGTHDDTTTALLPSGVNFINEVVGGFDLYRKELRRIADRGVQLLLDRWAPKSRLLTNSYVAMPSVQLPPLASWFAHTEQHAYALMSCLRKRYNIVCPVNIINGDVYCRLSAQIYVVDEDFERLAAAVLELAALDEAPFDFNTFSLSGFEW